MITNRILLVFLLAFAAMAGLMAVYRLYSTATTGAAIAADRWGMIERTLYILSGVFITTAAALVVLALVSLANPVKARVFGGLAVPALLLSAACLIMALFNLDGVRVLYAVLPAVAVLYLIFYTYQRDFFFLATLTGLGVFTLWFMRSQTYMVNTGWQWLAPMAVAAALLAVAAGLTLLRKHGGLLNAGKIRLRVFAAGTKYRFMYAGCGLIAVAVLLAFLFGNAMAFYLIFVLFGLLFIAAIYYTVKLM
jgi:hypothetical protein